MPVFACNLLMKSMTTSALNRFGFHRVLVVNGLLSATTIAACATITVGMPLSLVCIRLVVSSLTRSMQFTALNTAAVADIAQPSLRPSPRGRLVPVTGLALFAKS